MTGIRRISHVAVVVDDIEAALRFWRDALGLQVAGVEQVPEQQAEVAFLPIGESDIELVKPMDGDSGAARFLRSRGPGMHHLCLEVEDLDETLSRLTALGVRLVTPEPVVGAGNARVAFVHPQSAFGVLLELTESGNP